MEENQIVETSEAIELEEIVQERDTTQQNVEQIMKNKQEAYMNAIKNSDQAMTNFRVILENPADLEEGDNEYVVFATPENKTMSIQEVHDAVAKFLEEELNLVPENEKEADEIWLLISLCGIYDEMPVRVTNSKGGTKLRTYKKALPGHVKAMAAIATAVKEGKNTASMIKKKANRIILQASFTPTHNHLVEEYARANGISA